MIVIDVVAVVVLLEVGAVDPEEEWRWYDHTLLFLCYMHSQKGI